jgi:predicted amidohydrolase YtcJ
MTGDLLLYNGKILTMDNANPEVSAVAIRDGRVVAVGTDARARAEMGQVAQAIDLRGRTATPGFIDAHAHPMSVGAALADLDLSTPPNHAITDLVALVARETKQLSKGKWIVGRGYDQARLADNRHPTRHDLDAVAPDHPVLLIRVCHHIAVANSRALALAGINPDTPNPPGGLIDRDEHGAATGVVRESAHQLLRDAIGAPTEQSIVESLLLAGTIFREHGITSATEAGIAKPEELRVYQRLRRDGQLPFRANLMMMIDETLGPMEKLGLQTGFGDDWLRIGPAKLFSDGSIGGRTARMREPYVDEPANVGLWMMETEHLKEMVLRAHRAGFQIGIHAIGDAAIDLVLDAYEAAQVAFPRSDPRHRIEHCSIVDEATIQRIARLGVIPIPGTTFLRYTRDSYLQNLGSERIRYAYALATFARYGIIAAASSDAPVVPASPMLGIQTMVTRKDAAGQPVWDEERISLTEALRTYTANGAYASFEENIKGTLAPGFLGDVAVFETDLHQVSPDDLIQVKVDLTIQEGEIVYARSG